MKANINSGPCTFVPQIVTMLNRFFAVLLFFILASVAAYSQVLSGVIVDIHNKPIPYSTVYVKEVSLGTAANEEGLFELKLKEGNYTCTFQSMGYESVTRVVPIERSNPALRIVLQGMVYSLQEVEVNDGGEDPAYRIMRKVIRKAPLYAQMVKSFNAEVYIRGSLTIRKISAMVKWMARDDLKESDIKEGDTFLEESVNEIDFTAPNLTRQRVKSIHSTFPGGNEGRSSGAMGFISGNIYKPDAFGNAWSPLAPGAFKFYRFQYEGVSTIGEVNVDRIKVIPKGDGPQYLRGYLYVIEGLWCIYAVDVSIDEQLGLTLQLHQLFGEVREGAWLPVTNRLKMDMDLMGNQGGFLYNTSIRYNNLVVNPPYLKPSVPKKGASDGFSAKRKQHRSEKLNEKAKELMAIELPTTSEANKLAKIISKNAELKLKDSLRRNHEYVEAYKAVFDSNARKYDSIYWNRVRPIPLALNELSSVKSFDSIQNIRNLALNDTTNPEKSKKGRFYSKLIFGGRHDIDTSCFFQTDGLINLMGVSFNTVDGFVYKTGLRYEDKLKGGKTLSLGFKPGYAFSRKAFIWDAVVAVKSDGRHKNAFALHAGSGSFDYNIDKGAALIENTLASLFFRRNLKRLYNKDYIELNHEILLAKGLNLKSGAYISDNTLLRNYSDFSFFFNKSRDYMPNIPENMNFRMQAHQDLMINFRLSYKPIPYYTIQNGIKIPRKGMNQTPEFSLGYRKAIPAKGFDSDFDLLTMGIAQKYATGKQSNIEYLFEAGYFISNKVVYFDDFRHFALQPLVIGVRDFFPVLQMGDYYRYSTDTYFAEAHFIYRTPFFLLTRLPLIRNRMWTENFTLNYIYVPEYKNCVELGYGVGNSFYSIGVFAGFERGKYRIAGLRISLSMFGKQEVTIGM
ncbi:MAG: DUF5686 and carboxypeptidase regulatory-like domain-containing protein [Lentimicrobium sp.]|nr:DUF5686 and carboxypeptidase regulatory-like domain-containing protein [Lentimicrobium sp.]